MVKFLLLCLCFMAIFSCYIDAGHVGKTLRRMATDFNRISKTINKHDTILQTRVRTLMNRSRSLNPNNSNSENVVAPVAQPDPQSQTANTNTDNANAKEEENANAKKEECIVCMDIIEPGDRNRKVLKPCGHPFHRKCINKWFKDLTHNTCPLCRGPVDRRQLPRNREAPRPDEPAPPPEFTEQQEHHEQHRQHHSQFEYPYPSYQQQPIIDYGFGVPSTYPAPHSGSSHFMARNSDGEWEPHDHLVYNNQHPPHSLPFRRHQSARFYHDQNPMEQGWADHQQEENPYAVRSSDFHGPNGGAELTLGDRAFDVASAIFSGLGTVARVASNAVGHMLINSSGGGNQQPEQPQGGRRIYTVGPNTGPRPGDILVDEHGRRSVVGPNGYPGHYPRPILMHGGHQPMPMPIY